MRLDLQFPLPLTRGAVQAELMTKDSAARAGPEAERLQQVSQEFESLLLEQMLKTMRETVPASPLFGRNRGQEIFNEMLDGEFARRMEKRGGLGIATYMVARMDHRTEPPATAPDSRLLRKTR